ncbi:restriction endonuclease subunit S [Planktothrix agardhii 1033]|nr:restriction endonuclease subunit S [Planktothrix agardhii 1033]
MELINKNQVPEGYKKTEVGVIPEDWNIQTVSDIAIVKGGKRLPKGISLSDIPNPYPYIRVADMYEGGINTDDIKYVPEHIAPLIKNYRIYSTDLFISVAGTLGIIGEVPATMNGANLTENADRITGITCNKKFLFYALISERIKNEIDSQRTIGAQPKLALRRIEDFKLAFPNSDEEQKAIAQTLSDVDALIDELDKLIAKKRHIKTATMQQLLTGKTRLPGFGEGKGYKKSALGLIPEDWEVKKLGDVIKSFQNGYAFSAQNYVDYGIPIITMAQIGLDGAFQFMEECVNHWPFIYSNKLQSYQVKNGDVIISMTDVTPEKNLIGRMTIVDLEPDKTALLNQRVGLLRLDFKKVNPIFITTFSHQRKWRQYCLSVASLGVQANIGTKEITDGILVLPPLPEQQTIAQVLSDIDTEITALEKRRAKTQAIKQGMMQELLIGRTRLI